MDHSVAGAGMTARLTCLSGLGPKEPAAFLVEVGARRILLDLGIGPGGAMPALDAAGRIDAVVLSHGHPDHAGGLAALDRIGLPPVFATAEVLARLPVKVDGHPLPPRGLADVVGVPVETGRSGHAIGGVWLRIAVDDGLLYMGDHTAASEVFAADPPPPTATVVLDCSYGTTEEARVTQAARLLALSRCGPLLLPVPADGRGVEIALFLAAEGVPIAVCEEVRAALAALAGVSSAYARGGAAEAAGRLAAAAPEAGGANEDTVVAAGATADAGTAAALLPRWLERGGTVAFTGHLAEVTAGARLVAAGQALQIRWNVHPTATENADLVRRLGARRVIPAFGDRADWPGLAARFAPAVIWTDDGSALKTADSRASGKRLTVAGGTR